ncbi:unnamed protein product [Diamesa serratosioi]
MEPLDSEIPLKLEKTIVKSLVKIEDDEEDMNEESKKNDITSIIHPPPRLFRKSLIYKTKKMFNVNIFEEKKVIKKCRPLRDNVIWCLIMLVGFLAAFCIADRAWTRFQTNPTLTSMNADVPHYEITYPTISVCPIKAFDGIVVKEVAALLTKTENEDLENVLKTIPGLSYTSIKTLNISFSVSKLLQNQDLRELAFKMKIPCESVFESCSFKSNEINCCDNFYPVYSEIGLCYAFNAKYYGTPRNEVFNDRLNVLHRNGEWTFEISLQQESLIYMNSADEILNYETQPIYESNSEKEANIYISMTKTRTDENARDLSLGQRKCIFDNEMKMKYYKDEVYSYSGCMKECRIDKVMLLCGCIPPFYSPTHQRDNLPNCNSSSFPCLSQDNITDLHDCNHCELSCTDTVFTMDQVFDYVIPANEQSRIKIELRFWPILTYNREVRFGFLDFIVAFGSILALFLSFSLLSAVEVVFYLLRACSSKIFQQVSESKKEMPSK